MTTIEPNVQVFRTWVFTYARPGGSGWPVIPLRKAGQVITPAWIRVVVADNDIAPRPGDQPDLVRVMVKGGEPCNWTSLACRASQSSALSTDAPDWVMDLAADAVQRAREGDV